MSDWRSDLLNAIEDLTIEVITDVVTEVATGIETLASEISRETQLFLDTDLDAFLNILLHPLTVDSIEDWVNTHFSTTVNQYSGVAIKPHPLCAECKNYHGQAYNEVSLVCGMHPYGIHEGQNECDDRELSIDR